MRAGHTGQRSSAHPHNPGSCWSAGSPGCPSSMPVPTLQLPPREIRPTSNNRQCRIRRRREGPRKGRLQAKGIFATPEGGAVIGPGARQESARGCACRTDRVQCSLLRGISMNPGASQLPQVATRQDTGRRRSTLRSWDFFPYHWILTGRPDLRSVNQNQIRIVPRSKTSILSRTSPLRSGS